MPQKPSKNGESPTPLVFPAPIPDTLENVTKRFFRRPKTKPQRSLKKSSEPTEERPG